MSYWTPIVHARQRLLASIASGTDVYLEPKLVRKPFSGRYLEPRPKSIKMFAFAL